jgi:TRAP-type C4-dicarboxylate transport system permease small subunit
MEKNMLHRINQVLSTGCQLLANVLLILILVAVFAEVVSRYIFQQSHGSMEEFSKWSQIWIAYLMIGIVEQARGHIKVDILFNRLSAKGRIPLLIVFDITTLVFAVVLFWSGVQATANLYRLGLTSTSGIPVPMWTVMLAAPFGAVLLAFFGLQHLLDNVHTLTKEE